MLAGAVALRPGAVGCGEFPHFGTARLCRDGLVEQGAKLPGVGVQSFVEPGQSRRQHITIRFIAGDQCVDGALAIGAAHDFDHRQQQVFDQAGIVVAQCPSKRRQHCRLARFVAGIAGPHPLQHLHRRLVVFPRAFGVRALCVQPRAKGTGAFRTIALCLGLDTGGFSDDPLGVHLGACAFLVA